MFDFTRLFELLKFSAEDPLFFNSSLFLFIFLFFYLVYSFTVKNKTLRVVTLLAFSLYFYYRSGGLFFLLLLLTSLLSYSSGFLIHRAGSEAKKRLFLILGILANLSLLIYFKYTNFFIQVYSDFFKGTAELIDIIMPLGISFFTFKALSYIIDIYLEKIEPESNFLNFTLYIAFFANLLAGPIDRAGGFLSQLKSDFKLDESYIGRGTFLIMMGLLKKDVVADYISLNFVDRVFENPLMFSGIENLLAVYGYALQIYCDFSGYSDMAIGIALLLGLKLMDNFNYPYKARSVAEFWRRWHISLSTWLLDYLFKPMQMKFRGMRTVGNALALFLTFAICGLWHGASWTFIAWGAMHGLFMAVSLFMRPVRNYFYGKTKLDRFRLTSVVQTIITFHIIAFAWVFFKASTFEQAVSVFSQIYYAFHPEVFSQFITAMPQIFTIIIAGFLIHFLPEKLEKMSVSFMTSSPIYVKALMLAVTIWIAVQVRSADLQPFIYFQF